METVRLKASSLVDPAPYRSAFATRAVKKRAWAPLTCFGHDIEERKKEGLFLKENTFISSKCFHQSILAMHPKPLTLARSYFKAHSRSSILPTKANSSSSLFL